MNPIWQLFQAGMALFQGSQLEDKWKQYNAAIEAQIKEGKDLLTARRDVAMHMISTDPDFQKSRAILAQMPKDAREEVFRVGQVSEKNRQEFLNQYHKNTGAYLTDLDKATAASAADWEKRTGAISGQYGQREADVMGLLEGQGNQALRDTQRTFGEEAGATYSDAVSRGLTGHGSWSSLSGGFATRKADELARIRERVGAQKAEALAGLRGDTLGFGERAATLGAGFREQGIGRRLGAYAGVESGRAAYDAAMRGDTQSRRAAALDRAYGFDTNQANWLTGQGNLGVQTYLGTQGDLAGYLGGGPVQNVPPDPSGFNNSLGGFGYGRGYSS